MPNDVRHYRRALFIRFGGLGDILLATPTMRALADAFPGIEIDFMVGTGNAAAVSGNPFVRRVLEFDKHGQDARFMPFLQLLSRLHRARYDLVVNLHPNARSLMMGAVTGARHLVFRKHMGVEAATGRVSHAVDDFLKELCPLGISPPSDGDRDARQMDFVVPASARQGVDDLLAEAGVPASSRLLVISLGATRSINRWAPERFAAVAAHFAARPDVRVAVTGWAPWERDAAAEIAGADPRILNLAGRLTMKELGALLQRADALLTCDTGPLHIGAALRTPLVVLSGAADPDRTGPLTENATVLIDRTLSCVPCRDRTCARGDVMCMQNLSVAAVIDSVERRLLPVSRGGIPLAVVSGPAAVVRG